MTITAVAEPPAGPRLCTWCVIALITNDAYNGGTVTFLDPENHLIEGRNLSLDQLVREIALALDEGRVVRWPGGERLTPVVATLGGDLVCARHLIGQAIPPGRPARSPRMPGAYS